MTDVPARPRAAPSARSTTTKTADEGDRQRGRPPRRGPRTGYVTHERGRDGVGRRPETHDQPEHEGEDEPAGEISAAMSLSSGRARK